MRYSLLMPLWKAALWGAPPTPNDFFILVG